MLPATSPSPPRPWSRQRKWVLATAFLALLLVVLYFGARQGFKYFLGSAKLLKVLGERTGGLLDTPAGFKPLAWQQKMATSEGFLAQGPPEHSLQELRAKGLTASFDERGLWQRRLIFQKLVIEQLQAAFSSQTAGALEQDIAAPPELQKPEKGSSFFRIDLQEVEVKRTTLLWGETPEDFGAFREVGLRLWTVDKNLGAYGSGGTFQIGALPEAAVREFQLRYEGSTLTIDWGSLTLGGESEVKVSGSFQFTKPGSMDLQLGFRQCPVRPFLSAEMRTKFDGSFESDTHVQSELGGEKPGTFSGPVRVEGATLQNIPALAKLTAFTQEPRFKNLHLQVLRGNYSYTKPHLAVMDLVAEAQGLFQVEGDVTLEGKQVHADLQLGVSTELLKSFPGAQEEVFTKHRNDYYWTTVKIGGTTDKPEDDLKERLVAAAKKHIVQKVLTPVTKPLEALKKPVEAVIEKLKELF